MISQDDARARVARGAAHLDAVRPGWAGQIDTGTLNLSSCRLCIAAQLVTGWKTLHLFTQGLSQLGIRGDQIEEYGFATVGTYESFDLLQDAWIEAISARLHPVMDAAGAAVSQVLA